jgi:dicarboxylate transporter 10
MNESLMSRIQTATVKQGMIMSMVTSFKTEGPRSLFHGLTATWLRQGSYSITRFAAYEKFKESFIVPGVKNAPTSGELAMCAAGAGAIAG